MIKKIKKCITCGYCGMISQQGECESCGSNDIHSSVIGENVEILV